MARSVGGPGPAVRLVMLMNENELTDEALMDLVFCAEVCLMDPEFLEKADEGRLEEVRASRDEACELLVDRVEPDEFMPSNLQPIDGDAHA